MSRRSSRDGRNEKIPSRLTPSLGAALRFFSPIEAKQCSATTKIKVRDGIVEDDWQAIALGLTEAFYAASIFEAARAEAGLSVALDAYDRIGDAIDNVFKAFGFAGTYPDDLPQFELGYRGKPFPILEELKRDSSRICIAGNESRDNALDELPSMLMHVRDLTRLARKLGLYSATAGAKSEDGLDSLFCHLSGLFFTIFGPLRKTEIGALDNESVLWTRAVLGHACLTIPHRIFLDVAESRRPGLVATSAVAELSVKASQLSAASIGKRLRSGFLAWCALPTEAKWPVCVWCPNGIPEGSVTPFVPEWLRGVSIPASQGDGTPPLM